MFKVGDIVRLKSGQEPMIVMKSTGSSVLCSYLYPNALMSFIQQGYTSHDGERLIIDFTRFCNNSYKRIHRSHMDYMFANENCGHDFNLFGRSNTKFWSDFCETDLANDWNDGQFHHHKNLFCWFEDEFNHIVIQFKNMNTDIVTLNEEKGRNTMAIENQNTLYQVTGTDKYGIFLTTNSMGQAVLEMKDGKGTVQAFDKKDIEEVVPWTFFVKYSNGKCGSYKGDKDVVNEGDILLGEDFDFGRVTKVNTKDKLTGKYFKGYKLGVLESFESGKDA